MLHLTHFLLNTFLKKMPFSAIDQFYSNMVLQFYRDHTEVTEKIMSEYAMLQPGYCCLVPNLNIPSL